MISTQGDGRQIDRRLFSFSEAIAFVSEPHADEAAQPAR